jgi:phage baseplate assembly protein W
MNVGFPYGIDARGRTAEADDDRHVRDLIEQVLFTAPGERVNRPTFGSGILGLVFEPNSDALATAMEHTVHGALQQTLAELIVVERVDVSSDEGTIEVTVAYADRRTQQRRVATVVRQLP